MQMQSLGEMATWLPLPGAIPQFCARYVDGALGFAVGWNVSSSPTSSQRRTKWKMLIFVLYRTGINLR